jgi:uncharacterized protein
MLDKFLNRRKLVFVIFSLLICLSIYPIFKIQFSFAFEQFFPQKDDELTYFNNFIKEFETDDNFLLIGIKREKSIFDSRFLSQVDSLSLECNSVYNVQVAKALTNIDLPVKSPFGIVTVPALSYDDSTYFEQYKSQLTNDERFVNAFLSKDAKVTVIAIKTKDKIRLDESEILINSIDSLVKPYHFEEYHYLGRAYFQKEIVEMEKWEVGKSTVISAILVGFILFIIFRRWRAVFIALMSIGVSMVLFFALLSAMGREFTALSALYPVLMVIIGTADIVHMMSKYIDELRKGNDQRTSMKTTIKEIGFATLITAVTTAIGFATLVTSRIKPIADFGLNAAIGVMIAYITVLILSTSIMQMFTLDQLIKTRDGSLYWDKLLEKIYLITKNQKGKVIAVCILMIGISIYGTSTISTNLSIFETLPTKSRVTDDFVFFEKNLAGFRPLEFAVLAQKNSSVYDYNVVQEVEKFDRHLRSLKEIKQVHTYTMIMKSINQMEHNNKHEYYNIPTDSSTYNKQLENLAKIPKSTASVLVNKNETKARISTRILDLGADTVMKIGDDIEKWVTTNIDTNIVKFKRTGSGFILDKNVRYVMNDLIIGLFWEVGIISLVMGLMLKDVRMIFIFLIPNLFPLLFAAALIGFSGVHLDAGISMVFTVVFGIAIDDTIHFLSFFKLNMRKGHTVEESLHITMHETGKPVCITTIILFFGFMVMMFSLHPPSVAIGKLISVTLIAALLSDLFINPILIRWLIKDKVY